MKKAVTNQTADKKMVVLRERKKQHDIKPRRRQARGSYRPQRISTLDQLAVTNSYVLKGKVKKVEQDGRGRPTVMTQEVVKKLEEAFAYDATVEEACLLAGISAKTYYNFIEVEKDFLQRVEELRHGATLMLRRTFLIDAINNPDNALKYLERKVKKEFSLRSEVALTAKVVNRHEISPDQEALVKKAFENFMDDSEPEEEFEGEEDDNEKDTETED